MSHPHFLKQSKARQPHSTLKPNDCLCSGQSACAQTAAPQWRPTQQAQAHKTRTTPLALPSLTPCRCQVICVHRLTQKTNWGNGLNEWQNVPLNDLSHLNNQYPLVTFLWPTECSWREWISLYTACLFPPVLHMQSKGSCGGCSQRCVILIRQDQ